ncbi:MAG: TraR/DksA C4-type zinc finger protein [Arenicella sp.]|nr:TraR/DksA C4-type zinc finger protein [Arenicella sp.]
MDESLNLSSFSTQLHTLKLDVLQASALASNAAQPVELDQNRVGRLSRVDAMQGQAMAQANVERQKILLTEIERALAEIESGEYGRCVGCDEFIAIARVEADPVTQRCIVCATKLEQS